MKGYWIIFAGEVVSQEALIEYGRLWAPISERYNAKLKILDAAALLEADTTKRVVIVEFPSLALAKECYDDPEYAKAKAYGAQASDRELIIVEGDFS